MFEDYAATESHRKIDEEYPGRFRGSTSTLLQRERPVWRPRPLSNFTKN